MQKLTCLGVAMMILLGVNTAHAYGINGKTSLMCDAKDGTEYVINTTAFPQVIQVNSDYVNLFKVSKDKDGFRHYRYSGGRVEQPDELAMKGQEIFMVASDQMLPCK